MLALLALGGASAASPAFAGEGCENEARRVEQGSTYLPDCRAYELVSPPGTSPYTEGSLGGALPGEVKATGLARASVDSGDIAWASYYPLSESFGGFFNLSTRTEAGWSSASVIPPTSTNGGPDLTCGPSMFFSADLSQRILEDGFSSDGPEDNSGEYCPSNDPSLVADEPEGVQNIFLRDPASGSFQLVNATPTGVKPSAAIFEDASTDFSHIFFEDAAQLTPEAQDGLYEWAGGAVHLVTFRPNGTAVQGSLVDRGNEQSSASYMNAVSSDGKRAFFEAEGNLYVRENAEQEQSPLGAKGECTEPEKACTVQIDASQSSGPGGGGKFLDANAEGTKVYFSDDAGAMLTSDTQPGSGQNLYEYELQGGSLTDLTPVDHAEVMGPSGIAEDGSYFYFVASGSLALGATEGQPNLYVVHDGGAPSFIATLGNSSTGGHPESWAWTPEWQTARVSPNGRYIGFNSVMSLTGYDNTDANTGSPDLEIFLYDAVTDKLSCVSCDPNGAPVGLSELPGARLIGTGGNLDGGGGQPAYIQRNVLNNGHVFFNTLEPLVAGDVNGQVDVYEYAQGATSLLSSGTSSEESAFYDASPDGKDVFFGTAQGLVAGDGDNALSLYDARVEGGFAESAGGAAACNGEGCREAAPAGSVFSAPVSAIFTGPGNSSAPRNERPPDKTVKLTHRQKLVRALKACRHLKNLHRRATCRRYARRKFGSGK
jgi:hypothetical protein